MRGFLLSSIHHIKDIFSHYIIIIPSWLYQNIDPDQDYTIYYIIIIIVKTIDKDYNYIIIVLLLYYGAITWDC